MAEGMKALIIAFLLVGLFSFSLIGFAIQLAEDNNANQSIADEQIIRSVNASLSSQLTKSTDTANKSRVQFESETESMSTGFFILRSIMEVGRTFGSMIVGVYNLTLGAITTAFSLNPIITGTISAILIINIVFFAWRLYKRGD